MFCLLRWDVSDRSYTKYSSICKRGPGEVGIRLDCYVNGSVILWLMPKKVDPGKYTIRDAESESENEEDAAKVGSV